MSNQTLEMARIAWGLYNTNVLNVQEEIAERLYELGVKEKNIAALASTACTLGRNYFDSEGKAKPCFQMVDTDTAVKVIRQVPRNLWEAVCVEMQGKNQKQRRDYLSKLKANGYNMETAESDPLPVGTVKQYREELLFPYRYGRVVTGDIEQIFDSDRFEYGDGNLLAQWVIDFLKGSTMGIINVKQDVIELAFVKDGSMGRMDIYTNYSVDELELA